MIITAGAFALTFVVGKVYGARVEKAAVTLALAAFTKAKTVLAEVVAKAQTEARAEVERLDAIVKKYL